MLKLLAIQRLVAIIKLLKTGKKEAENLLEKWQRMNSSNSLRSFSEWPANFEKDVGICCRKNKCQL